MLSVAYSDDPGIHNNKLPVPNYERVHGTGRLQVQVVVKLAFPPLHADTSELSIRSRHHLTCPRVFPTLSGLFVIQSSSLHIHFVLGCPWTFPGEGVLGDSS